ncbi:MAG TPA: hypothetical protein VJB90_03750 [Candidatus Nanoarchaeia archaeon]|nr:hypothetical protein [Candidatus Nanoarchaeia archaeon]
MRIIALFVIFTILISGCGILEIVGLGGNDKPIDVNYNSVHTGVQGLDFSFAPDRPQSNYIIVPAGNDITVLIGIENKGAWDIPKGKGIIVLNFDKTYMDFPNNLWRFTLDEEIDEDLKGRSLTKPKGDTSRNSFNGKIFPLEELKKETTINAIACYEYGTEYIFDVCIDTDPTNTKPLKKACDLLQNKKKYNSITSGQGAPVAITQVDQAIRITPDNKLDIDFIIKIKNAGKGKIYDLSATPNKLCNEGGGLEEADKVVITADLAGLPLTCETLGEGRVFVREGLEGIVNCRVTGYSSTIEPSFLSKLKVTLNYDYVDSNGKIIILKKAGARV